MIVNGDGRPLGVSLSEARHIVALDGHVFVALPAAANVTLTLKITPLEGLIDASFVSSRLVGEELVVGSTSDCLYQVTLVNDDEGQGLVNLCDSLVSIYIMYDIVESLVKLAHQGTFSRSPLPAVTIYDMCLAAFSYSVLLPTCQC